MGFTKRLRHRWSSSNFVRHATTLAFGTLFAQFISFFSAPIVTRLFTPQDYGVLSVFSSWMMVVSVVATGRYEFAILLGDAREGWYSTVLTLLLTIVTALILLVGGFMAAAAGLIATPLYGLLAALSVLALGSNAGLYYWFNRNMRYPVLARNRIYGSLVAAGLGIGAGVLGLGALGLVAGGVIAQLMVALLLVWPSDFRAYPRPDTLVLKELAWRYRDYPKYLLVSGLLDRFSSQAHILLLVFLQGAASSGFIGLYERVISVPQRVLSGSIGDVFKQQASSELATHGHCTALYIRTTKRLALIGIAPSLVLIVAGPWLFGLVFGTDWRVAGELAQLLAAKFYAGFIVSPLSSLLYIGQAQRYDLYLQFGVAVCVPAGLFAGSMISGLKGAMVGYTAVYCCKYVVEYWIAWRVATGAFGKLAEPTSP